MVKGVLLYCTAMRRPLALAAQELSAGSPRYPAMSTITPKPSLRHRPRPQFDSRDRLILALYAQLRAERETREALEWAIENDAISPEVLQAMASDPVPVITSEDIAALERLLARDNESGNISH